MDGFGKGAGNILKGVLGGAAIMVTAPIKGTYVRTYLHVHMYMCANVYKYS
jgi:hypothetical protein